MRHFQFWYELPSGTCMTSYKSDSEEKNAVKLFEKSLPGVRLIGYWEVENPYQSKPSSQ